MHVLLIDHDDRSRMRAMDSIARGSDHSVSVDEATSYTAAFDRLDSVRYSCVILNFLLPDIDGLSMLDELCRRAVGAAVVVYSDNAMPVDDIIAHGAMDYSGTSELSTEFFSRNFRYIARLSAAELKSEPANVPRLEPAVSAPEHNSDTRAAEFQEALEVVAHDLRGPLNTIRIAMEGLDFETAEVDRQQLISVIKRSLSKATQMVDDLQLASRLAAGSLPMSLRRTTSQRFLDEVLDDFEPEAKRVGIGLSMGHIDSIELEVDVERLHRAMGALILAALKQAHQPKSLELALRCIDGHIEISLHDPSLDSSSPAHAPACEAGSGLAQLFPSGAGLSLAIARGIACAHGGDLSIRETAGGTTYTLMLPRHKS